MRPPPPWRRSPPRRMVPRGRNRPTSSPRAKRARRRLLVRVSKGSSRRSVGFASPVYRFSISSMGTSEEEVTLGHGKGCGRLAGEELAVGANLVGFGIDLDVGLPIVVDHVGLVDAPHVAHQIGRAS